MYFSIVGQGVAHFPRYFFQDIGNSTLHQLEKIIEYTGTPSGDSMKSLNCPYAESVISQIRVKKRSLNSYLGDCDDDIKDIIIRMLEFDPSQRITAEEVL